MDSLNFEPPLYKFNFKRNLYICFDVLDSSSYSDISRKYDLSKERIRQIFIGSIRRIARRNKMIKIDTSIYKKDQFKQKELLLEIFNKYKKYLIDKGLYK
jgi:hypothetical protein